MTERQFTQSVDIAAPVDVVDRCIVSKDMMAMWLNPMLKCEAIGTWSTEIGSRFRFTLKIPFLSPPSRLCGPRAASRAGGVVVPGLFYRHRSVGMSEARSWNPIAKPVHVRDSQSFGQSWVRSGGRSSHSARYASPASAPQISGRKHSTIWGRELLNGSHLSDRRHNIREFCTAVCMEPQRLMENSHREEQLGISHQPFDPPTSDLSGLL